MLEYTFLPELLTADGRTKIANVESMRITADEEWAPLYAAEIVAKESARLVTLPSPTTMRVRLRRIPGPVLTLADWTRTLGGAVAGWPTKLADITQRLGGRSADLPEQLLDLTLTVRDIIPDPDEGTATITLTGSEMDLQEIRRIYASTRSWPAGTADSIIVGDILRSAGMPVQVLGAGASPGSYQWEGGMSAYEVLGDRSVSATAPTHWNVPPARPSVPVISALKGLTVRPRLTPLKNQRYGKVRRQIDEATKGKIIWITGPTGYNRGEYSEETIEIPGGGTSYIYVAEEPGGDRTIDGANLTAVADLTVQVGDITTTTRAQFRTPGIPQLDIPPARVASIVWTYPEGRMDIDLKCIPTGGGQPTPIDPNAPTYPDN